MDNPHILYSIIIIPIIGWVIIPVLGKWSVPLRNSAALACVAVPLFLAIYLIPSSVTNPIYSSNQLTLGVNLSLAADGLAVFMAIVSSLISALIVIYSFDYISHYENQNEYYSMVVLFFGSMMGIVFSQNLIFLYIFWEITAITSWRLIGFFREKKDIIRADKSFLMTVFGSLLMFIGFLFLFKDTGSFDLGVIKESFRGKAVSNLTIGLILAGILSKSATLPFQTWLPDAGVAPSPVTALLHAAVLVKIGVYVFARLFVFTIPLTAVWEYAFPIIAGLSALISAGAAYVETDLKRLIAYSTISQIGFIFLGLSIGNTIGIIGGILFILMHGLAKAGLFLCAGIVEQNMETKDITQLGGLIKTMPLTAAAFLLCSFSIMGIPPTGGFFSKYLVMASSVEQGRFLASIIFLAAAFLTIMYLFRAFNMVFMGEAKKELKSEGSLTMVYVVVCLAVLSFAAGILVRYPIEFIQNMLR